MAGYNGGVLFILAVMLQFRGYLSGSACYERSYNYFTSSYYYSYYDYCSYGCCGYTTSRYCCLYYSAYDAYNTVSVSIGVIIGSVIGGIVFLGVMIAVVICCICKCSDRKPHRGAVVGPATTGTTGVAIVSNHMNMQPQPYYQMNNQHMPAVQPPPYNNFSGPGPGYVPAAYPPPPPAYPPPAYPPPPPQAAFTPTAPVEQPNSAYTPFAPSSTTAWNSAPPATTQGKP